MPWWFRKKPSFRKVQKAYVIKVVEGPDKDSLLSQRAEVKVGIRRPGKVEILDGLKEGDTVVIAGQQRLQKDGTQVRTVELGKPRPEAAAGPAGTASGAMAAAPAASAAAPSEPPAAARASVKPAPAARALDGPNPCLAELAGGAGTAGGQGRR